MADEGFVAVSRESITAGELRDFSLYLRRKDRFVLYRSPELPIKPDEFDGPARRRVGQLWVSAAERGKYLHHVEKNISTILADRRIAIPRRAEVLYEVSKSVVEDLLSDPEKKENLTRATDLAGDQVGFLERDPAAFRSLIALTSHDYYTYAHSVHVSVYAAALAQRHERLGSAELKELATAGLLHDLGKTRIPSAVLNKPGKLEPDEWALIKRHPLQGRDLARRGGVFPESVLRGIWEHHERYSGGGYPRNLSVGAIHPFARYLSLADVFDAMTTKRSYDRRYSAAEALEVMVEKLKGHFAPDLLKIMIKMLGEGGER